MLTAGPALTEQAGGLTLQTETELLKGEMVKSGVDVSGENGVSQEVDNDWQAGWRWQNWVPEFRFEKTQAWKANGRNLDRPLAAAWGLSLVHVAEIHSCQRMKSAL